MNKKQYKEFGKQGATKRWDEYRATRKELIEEVSTRVDKEILNLIQSKLSNDAIVKLLKVWGGIKK